MSTRRYASDTEVSVERSKAEIEGILQRYGAEQFLSGWDQTRAVVACRMHGRHIKFVVPLPARDAEEFRLTPSRKWERSDRERAAAWEQACRARWRALALVIKAKLEAIEVGITDFDTEFMGFIQLPSGETFGEWARPQIERAYTLGEMPALLALPGETGR